MQIPRLGGIVGYKDAYQNGAFFSENNLVFGNICLAFSLLPFI
jgi:hypothetical protein